MKTKSAGVLAIVCCLALIGCEQTAKQSVQQRSLAELDATVSRLEATVKGLEEALAKSEAERANWVLWYTARTVVNRVGISGPIPSAPVDAFSTKAECISAGEAVVINVLKRGEGRQVGSLSYVSAEQFGDVEVTYRCLPTTVDARLLKKT